jgi:ssDNA-binding replication factor A large subunit
MTEKYTSKKLKIAQSFQIKDLRVGMKKVKLEAKVVEVSKPRYVVTRFGNCASVANAMVSDDTGKIKLCLVERSDKLNRGWRHRSDRKRKHLSVQE